MVEKILDVLKQIEGPNSDKLFLDIGTNIGFYTFNVAAAGVATASFEALEYNAELVRGSIGLNPSFSERVNLFKSAVSSAPAPAMCVHSAGGNPRNQGNGMLVPAEECAQSGSLTSTEQVPVNRIDALIQGSKLKGRCIDVIKADIEGFEAEALRGSVGAWVQGGCKPCLVQFEYIRKYAEKGGRDGNSIFEFLIGEQGWVPACTSLRSSQPRSSSARLPSIGRLYGVAPPSCSTVPVRHPPSQCPTENCYSFAHASLRA